MITVVVKPTGRVSPPLHPKEEAGVDTMRISIVLCPAIVKGESRTT
jgi:hypothetical protein